MPERLDRGWHHDRFGLDNVNAHPDLVCGLDHGALEQVAFGRMEQRVRTEDLVEALWESPLGRNHTARSSAGDGAQHRCDSAARSFGRGCDDASWHPVFSNGVIRLTWQGLVDELHAPAVEHDRCTR